MNPVDELVRQNSQNRYAGIMINSPRKVLALIVILVAVVLTSTLNLFFKPASLNQRSARQTLASPGTIFLDRILVFFKPDFKPEDMRFVLKLTSGQIGFQDDKLHMVEIKIPAQKNAHDLMKLITAVETVTTVRFASPSMETEY